MQKNHNKIEAEWAERIQKGDREAFNKLFIFYYDRLCQFVWYYVKNKDTSEDIVQDLFYKLWINRKTWNFAPAIANYLYKAARNYSLNFLKKIKVIDQSFDSPQEEPGSYTTPEKEFFRKEVGDEIRAAISELPEQCQIIFKMKKIDGLTYREIAEIKDISIKTVETQMGRALKYLRKRLTLFLSVFSI